jgi:hypothetical protein
LILSTFGAVCAAFSVAARRCRGACAGRGRRAGALTADGTALVAVDHADGPSLVRVDLASGAVSAITGTAGLTEPATSTDGRIAAIRAQSDGSSQLVIVPEGSSTPTVLANVPYGLNWHPSWTRDDQVVFVHRDDLAPPTTGPWPREPLEAPTATTTSIPSPRTSTRGATLHLDHVTARRIGLIVRPCPGCGSLDVSLAGHDLGRISTSARSTHYRQLRWLPTTTSYTGTLTIRTTSTAPDYIDGFLSTR